MKLCMILNVDSEDHLARCETLLVRRSQLFLRLLSHVAHEKKIAHSSRKRHISDVYISNEFADEFYVSTFIPPLM